MKTAFLFSAFAASAFAQYGGIYRLDQGATSVTITNSGPLGGSQTIKCEVGATEICKIQFSIAGFTSEAYTSPNTTACPNPCAVSLNTEYGRVAYWYTVRNAADTITLRASSALYLAFTRAPCGTAPFTIPVMVHGFKDYETCVSFSVAEGTPTSDLSVWVWALNLRNGLASVIVNGVEHIIENKPMTGFTCTGTVCTGTTIKPHALSAGQTIQLNGFNETGGAQGYTTGDAQMNSAFTVATAPTPTTFTVASTLPAGDWNTNFGTVGQSIGKTVSASVFCADETRYFGCLDGTRANVQLLIPLGSGEIVAGATNTISFRFRGDPLAVVHGWWLLDFNVIHAAKQMDQIVATGANAVARTTSAHGWSPSDTLVLWDAPGPRFFNGKRTITAVGDTTHFTFAWALDTIGGPDVYGSSPSGTYVVPTSREPTIAKQPTMWAAKALIPTSSYALYDPANFPSYGGNAATGNTLYNTATLKDRNPYFPNSSTLAKCRDCHTINALDLKKLGWHPYVIKIASLGRGLTETEGNHIAAYVASNPANVPANCRPWNPLYQPAPRVDALSADNWMCGHLGWQTTYDQDTAPYLTPGGSFSTWAPGSNANFRQIPIYLAFDHWMRFLPATHPLDFFNLSLGTAFTGDQMWTLYQSYLTGLRTPVTLGTGVNASATAWTVSPAIVCTNNDFLQVDPGLPTQEYIQVTAGCNTTSVTVLRAQNSTSAASHASGAFIANFSAYAATGAYMSGLNSSIIGSNFQGSRNIGAQNQPGYFYPSMWGQMYFDVFNWGASRLWELFNHFQLQDMLDQATIGLTTTPNARAFAMDKRGQAQQFYFNWAPHRAGYSSRAYLNTDTSSGNNWILTTNTRYQLQLIMSAGNRMQAGNGYMDTQYSNAFFTSNSTIRPGMWMKAMPNVFNLQNTWGWTNPYDATGCRNIESISLRYPFRFVSSDIFSSDAEEAAIVLDTANRLVTYSGTFTTLQLQNYFNNCGGGLGGTPNPTNAYNNTGNFIDSLAYGLPVMRFWAVPSGTTDAIVTWANALFTGGHDFATDTAATCAWVGVPRVLKCSNVP